HCLRTFQLLETASGRWCSHSCRKDAEHRLQQLRNRSTQSRDDGSSPRNHAQRSGSEEQNVPGGTISLQDFAIQSGQCQVRSVLEIIIKFPTRNRFLGQEKESESSSVRA